MDALEPIEAARRIVEELVPFAEGALLAGSVLTSQRTVASDLDIVIFVSEDHESFRETVSRHGWLAELFVSTPSSFAYFVQRETAARRSPLLQMCSDGVVLVSLDGMAERRQEEAKKLLLAGPPPLSVDELDQRRYRLTDLLDDFTSTKDVAELTFITGNLLNEAAELALCSSRKWLGTGKWLVRQLRNDDPDLAARLTQSVTAALVSDDRDKLRAVVLEILDRVGGPLSEGYRQNSSLK
jgi:hypothetical protein